jgi:uncharacterized protein YihD (DUF1040 family)
MNGFRKYVMREAELQRRFLRYHYKLRQSRLRRMISAIIYTAALPFQTAHKNDLRARGVIR